MSRQRALIVIDQLRFGGAERHSVFLAVGMRNCGFDTFLLSLFGGGRLEAILKKSDVDYVIARSSYQRVKDSIPFLLRNRLQSLRYILLGKEVARNDPPDLRDLSNLDISIQTDSAFGLAERQKETKVKRILQYVRPDIVHVHTWQCKRALRWARECGIRKTIYSHHNMLSVRHNESERGELAECMTYASELILDSHEEKRDFLRHIPFTAENAHVVPPVSGFVATVPNRIPFASVNGVTIGTLSNLGAVKGVVFLLDATRILQTMRVPIRVLVAGEGSSRARLEFEAKKLKVEGAIDFLGYVRSEDHFFGSLDIFVLPSLSEAMPLVLIEAMSAGLPVVASRVGGIPEVVIDGETGLLATPGDAAELARMIHLLCKDSTLRTKMGRAGRERYVRHYSNDEVLRRYSTIYRDAAPGSPYASN